MTHAQAHHRWANSATWAHAHPLRTTLESHAQAHPSRAKFSKWLAITVSGDAAHSDQQLGLDAVARPHHCVERLLHTQTSKSAEEMIQQTSPRRSCRRPIRSLESWRLRASMPPTQTFPPPC